MWGQVFTHVYVALVFFQIIMAALLAIKGSFSAILVRIVHYLSIACRPQAALAGVLSWNHRVIMAIASCKLVSDPQPSSRACPPSR